MLPMVEPSQGLPATAEKQLPAARLAKKRIMSELAGPAQGQSAAGDIPESELLPAFDRAIAEATAHAKMLPEDKHQVFALRKGKAAVIESLKRGDDISLGALHTLRGVGHWVVQEVKRQLEGPGSKRRATGSGGGSRAPPPTPQSFTWWYLGRDGKPVVERNSAEFTGPVGGELFRACIMHSSGRMEKAWLPDAKAPPRSPGRPPSAS